MQGQNASQPRGVLRTLAHESQLTQRAQTQTRCADVTARASTSGCSLLQFCNEKGGQGTQMRRRPRMDRVCRVLVTVCNDIELQSALSNCVGDPSASFSSSAALRPMFIYSGTGCSDADQRRVHELYRTTFPSSYRDADVRAMLNSTERGLFATVCICSDAHGLLGAATTKLHQVNKVRAPRNSRADSQGSTTAAAEIVYIAVQPKHRGRRIGAILITMTARLAQLLACNTLLVSAACHAIPFWQRPKLLQLRHMAPECEQVLTSATIRRKRRPVARSGSDSRRAVADKISNAEAGTGADSGTDANNDTCASASFALLTAQLRAKHHGLESAVAGATLLSHHIEPHGQAEYMYWSSCAFRTKSGNYAAGDTEHLLPHARVCEPVDRKSISRRKRKPTAKACSSRTDGHGENLHGLGVGTGIGHQGGGGILASLGCMPR